MGRTGIWIVVTALVLAIYAGPAAAQVSVAVGVGTPHVGASVVVGAPVYGAYPYYPPYPYAAPYPYYAPYYYPYAVPYGPVYYRSYPGYYGGAYYYRGAAPYYYRGGRPSYYRSGPAYNGRAPGYYGNGGGRGNGGGDANGGGTPYMGRYNDFAEGRPNSSNATDEDCGAFDSEVAWQWNDRECSKLLPGFACEEQL